MSFQRKRIIIDNYYIYRTPQSKTSYLKNSLNTWILITFELRVATVLRECELQTVCKPPQCVYVRESRGMRKTRASVAAVGHEAFWLQPAPKIVFKSLYYHLRLSL